MSSAEVISCTRLRSYPHPPLRGTFPQKGGHGPEGRREKPKPLSRRERGWGEGPGRTAPATIWRYEASHVPSSAPSGHLPPQKGAMVPRGEGRSQSPSPVGRGVGVRVRGQALTRSVARGFARTLIRPCGAPSPEGRREKPKPLSSWERGWGEGAASSAEAIICTRLRTYPHPPLRGTFPQKGGHGPEGRREKPKPLSRRERGWGEGTEPRITPTQTDPDRPRTIVPTRRARWSRYRR
ncbi:hypothetical protein NB697_002397 [Xanthomonas sacchari]|nr:hypothetical protein [Xanthomonas sacchari]